MRWPSLHPMLSLISGLSVVASLLPTAAWSAHVEGRAFQRFITIWLSGQDYDRVGSEQQHHFQALRDQGIFLTRYFAHTHPSQPNHLAAIAGDYFGLDSDDPVRLPVNISTVVDLFDAAGVSWKAYMEDIPSPGYLGEGSDGSAHDGNWEYVRKHNPFASFDSINTNGSRLVNVESFRDFETALGAKKLPEYVFITPNLMHGGDNMTLTDSTSWAHDFIEPLLAPDAFDEPTLILLTFGESLNHSEPNRIGSLLLGNAIPETARGTEDDTFYTHYSTLATLEHNWRMYHLGRYDVGANIFQTVLDAATTPESDLPPPNREPLGFETLDGSTPYPGALASQEDMWAPFPAPNLGLKGVNGMSILPRVYMLWKPRMDLLLTPYDGSGEPYDGAHRPVYKPQKMK